MEKETANTCDWGENGEGNTRKPRGTLTHRFGGSVSPFTLLVIPAPSTPNRNHKRGNRRARQNKTPGSDTIRLTGRQTLATPTATSGGEAENSLLLNPVAFGDRVGSVADNFVRFRIKSLRLQFKSILPSTAGGLLTYGILDDIVDSTTLPTNRDQILNLRRATEGALWRNTSLTWRPLDPQKWYYVSGGDTGSTARFENPASLHWLITDYSTSIVGAVGLIDVQYAIEFSGAAVTSLHASLPSNVPPTHPGTPRPSKEEVPGYVSIARPLMSLRK
jgi:hypothetical protein